jgi:hypothetical protein
MLFWLSIRCLLFYISEKKTKTLLHVILLYSCDLCFLYLTYMTKYHGCSSAWCYSLCGSKGNRWMCLYNSVIFDMYVTCQDQSRFCEKPSQNHIGDKRVAKNHTKTLDNLVIYRLNIIETRFHTWLNNFIWTFLPNLCRCQACNPTVWYFSLSHRCITRVHCDWHRKTSVHIVERLTPGPGDVITPVGVASSWRYRVIAPVGVMSSWRRRIICDVTAELWVLNFWIKFATIQAKNSSKYGTLISGMW